MISEKEKILLSLVKEFRKGRDDAFPEILRLVAGQVINLAYGYTHNLEDAKDIFQVVSWKIFKSLNSFKYKAKFSTWVYRVTINASIDFLRKRKTTFKLKDNLVTENSKVIAREKIDDKEKKEELKQAIARLPKIQKSVFVLKHFQRLKINEISRIMGCSPSTVKTHLSRAIDNLRKILNNKKED